MLYLYAIVRHWATAPEQPGIQGRPVDVVPIESVAVVVGEVAGTLDPDEEHVLAHARIVDELAEANDAVLPVRFGRGFRDLGELDLAITPLVSRLDERLHSLAGCVELGLHVVGEGESTARSTSGRDYMQRRLRDLSRQEAVADTIHAPLAERSRAAKRSSSVGVSALLRAAYLVPRDEVDGFRVCVAELRKRYAKLSFSCTGPWAPYSFAGFEEAA